MVSCFSCWQGLGAGSIQSVMAARCIVGLLVASTTNMHATCHLAADFCQQAACTLEAGFGDSRVLWSHPYGISLQSSSPACMTMNHVLGRRIGQGASKSWKCSTCVGQVNLWMGTLIDFCKEDLFRYKGILSIAGWEDKFIFQVTRFQ